MLIERLRQKLDEVRTDLRASSCTFYLRDPHWTDQFRLVAMSGVRFEEPMYGFVSPASARRVIAEGNPEIFSNHPREDGLGEAPVCIDEMPEENRPLFGDFVEREGVQSSARLIQNNDSGEPEAIFFVNFPIRVEFDESIKSRIGSCFHDLVTDLDTIRQELFELDAEWLLEATKIVSPAWSVADTNFYALDEPESYFGLLIKAALQALGIGPEIGFGTIHLFNVERNMLELHGSFGSIQDSHKALVHAVGKGRGVVFGLRCERGRS
jgi:hypothetical protein